MNNRITACQQVELLKKFVDNEVIEQNRIVGSRMNQGRNVLILENESETTVTAVTNSGVIHY